MTKKKLAWVCLLVSPLVLGGAAFCFSDRDPISQGKCDRIKNGMTEKEVEVILGKKKDGQVFSGFGDTYYWEGSRGIITVSFEFSYPFVQDAEFSQSHPR